PQNFFQYLCTLKTFVKRSNFTIFLNEVTKTSGDEFSVIYETNALKVRALLLTAEQKQPMQCDSVNDFEASETTYEPPQKKPKLDFSEQLHFDRMKVTKTEYSYKGKLNIRVDQPKTDMSIKPERSAVCYICKLPDIPGKFDAKKALALGLKKGPSYGKLTKGESVTTEEGVTITPDQVISPSTSGPIFVIINCPLDEMVEQLVHDPRWSTFFDTVCCMIHITPQNIFNQALYKEFVRKFSKTNHIVLNKESCTQHNTVYLSSRTIQKKLNLLSNDMFPLTASQQHIDPQHGFTCAENLQKFILTPINQQGINHEEAKQFLEDEPIEHTTITTIPCVPQPNNKWEQMVQSMSDTDFEVTFLGTGAALPSKYRNVSGILINLFERGGIILDCGEGTLGQLHRVYGAETENILKNIKVLWISHLHADHHLGVCKLLYRRSLLTSNKVVLIAPKALETFLIESSACMGIDFNFVNFVTINQLINQQNDNEFVHIRNIREHLNVDFKVVPVDHSCKDSFAAILRINDKFPIIYSGDTRPCLNLMKIKECGILIHEATFEDELGEEAIKKKHSTFGEAIHVGGEMDAWRILLTHFSQRYPKIPVLEGEFGIRSMIIFDLMKINAKQMRDLPSYLEPLRLLFAEELEKLQKERGKEDDV
ncbi:trz1, partial [Acrasis kona]